MAESMNDLKVKQSAIYAKKAKLPTYEQNLDFIPADTKNFLGCHSINEMVEHLENNKETELDARVICTNKDGEYGFKNLSKSEFIEAHKNNKKLASLKESSWDDFGVNVSNTSQALMGEDYIPILGGPFNKQLYLSDMLRQFSIGFYHYHHSPIAKAIVEITREFTLGRGWRADVKCKDEKRQKAALALWRSFEEVNNLYDLMYYLAGELCIYGEVMLWKLPHNETKIIYNPAQSGLTVPRGALPRIRIVDPSTIWDYACLPEDPIETPLFYQQVYPTQYQLYTGDYQGKKVPTSKFIYQQIPADQIIHVKVNNVSNEKRGRSDYFASVGYIKRLTDALDYSLAALLKNAAWSMDTTIEGNDDDLTAYMESQAALGEIPPAGSEFIHTKSVTRQYLGNVAGRGAAPSDFFSWCWSMISAQTRIPLSYFGTHLGGQQSRASAIVHTDPVTKKFEMRQFIYERVMHKISRWLFDMYGFSDCDLEVTFPELLTDDRSTKLKDLALSVSSEWISNKRAAEIAAKELNITDFDYELEKKEIAMNPAPAPVTTVDNPLSDPNPESTFTGEDQAKIRQNDGF